MDDAELRGELKVSAPAGAASGVTALEAEQARRRVGLGAVGGAALGAAPHVLHHVGPLAGAAVLAGASGTILFGILGLLAAIPFLARLQRRTGSWRMPFVMLAAFAALFVISTAVIGPALFDDEEQQASSPAVSPAEHEEHHQ